METSEAIFKDLVQKLIAAGEDEQELALWSTMYPSLNETEREALLANLQVELAKLQNR
jgi:hypothetical protein